MTRFLIRLDVLARSYMWIAWFLLAGMVLSWVWFALDRDPPFEILSVQPAKTHPGEPVIIMANVRRDTSRQCAAEISRVVIDSKGTPFIADYFLASKDFIAELARLNPGRLVVVVNVSPLAERGNAWLYSTIYYRCNMTHWIVPITVTTRLPFEVL